MAVTGEVMDAPDYVVCYVWIDNTIAHYWSVGQVHSWSVDSWRRPRVSTRTFLDCCIRHDGAIFLLHACTVHW